MGNNKTFTLNIPIGIQNLQVNFWMPSMSIDTLPKNYTMTLPRPHLYLTLKRDYYVLQAMSDADKKSLTFGMSDYNIKDIQEIFRNALEWFTPENKNKLYEKTEDGMLVFNGEYNGLNALYIDKYASVETGLKIAPSVLEIGQGVYAMGVVIYINRKDNYIMLREYEFIRLARFIIEFNFIGYMQFAMQCHQYCLQTGTILSEEEVRRRWEIQRQFNSNIKGAI
jgi:hypothetical protein